MKTLNLPVFASFSSITVLTQLFRYGKGYNKPSVCEMIFDTLLRRNGYQISEPIPA